MKLSFAKFRRPTRFALVAALGFMVGNFGVALAATTFSTTTITTDALGIGVGSPYSAAEVRSGTSTSNLDGLTLSQNILAGAAVGPSVVFRLMNIGGDVWNAARIRTIERAGYGGTLVFETNAAAGSPIDTTTEAMRIQYDGNVGIGNTAPSLRLVVGSTNTLEVNSSGNLKKINGVTYSWPSAQGAASTALTNDGAGNLTWTSPGGGGWSDDGTTVRLSTATDNVGIGSATANFKLDVAQPASAVAGFGVKGGTGAFTPSSSSLSDYGGLAIHARHEGGNTDMVSFVATGTDSGNYQSAMSFYTRSSGDGLDPVERMRIDEAGDVSIGTTTTDYGLTVSKSAVSSWIARFVNTNNASADGGLYIDACDTTTPSTGCDYIRFRTSGGATVADIEGDGSGSVVISTSSDARLKENVADTALGLDDLMRVKVRDFNYLSNPGKRVTGFVAQELYSAYPPAVSVGDDERDAQGNLVNPWGIYKENLVPLLVKSAQDLKSENDMLKAELCSRDATYSWCE